MEKQNLLFRQFFEKDSSTYTYLLADADTREGILIDPVLETLERDLRDLKELNIRLLYTLETHVHADHITSADSIRKKTGAKSAVGKETGVPCADILLQEGDALMFGNFSVQALSTPGHTAGCLSFVGPVMVFTGDALLVRGCGRTDFQGGSATRLFESVRTKLFNLPDTTLVYPAHDYRGHTVSTIAEEKQFNPRLNTSMSQIQFEDIMANLELDLPAKMMEAVPANLACGNRPKTT